MMSKEERIRFRKSMDSIRFAYKIGVFSKEYAKKRFRDLYARTFGVASGAYYEVALGDFEDCFCEEEW